MKAPTWFVVIVDFKNVLDSHVGDREPSVHSPLHTRPVSSQLNSEERHHDLEPCLLAVADLGGLRGSQPPSVGLQFFLFNFNSTVHPIPRPPFTTPTLVWRRARSTPPLFSHYFLHRILSFKKSRIWNPWGLHHEVQHCRS